MFGRKGAPVNRCSGCLCPGQSLFNDERNVGDRIPMEKRYQKQVTVTGDNTSPNVRCRRAHRSRERSCRVKNRWGG